MRLLIFDVDGVLEKDELIDKARKDEQFRQIAKRFNLSIEDAKKKYLEAKESLPHTTKQSSVYIFGALGFTREEFFKMVDDVDPTEIIEPHANCIEMLTELKKKNKIVTLSNTPRKASMKTLEVLKITQYIDRVYSSEDFTESKPSLNILKQIMHEMGFEAKNTMVVGDSLEKDIMPAHQLGITTVLFDPRGKYENTDEADHVVRDLMEITKLTQ